MRQRASLKLKRSPPAPPAANSGHLISSIAHVANSPGQKWYLIEAERDRDSDGDRDGDNDRDVEDVLIYDIWR
jgi:hypothetical protein